MLNFSRGHPDLRTAHGPDPLVRESYCSEIITGELLPATREMVKAMKTTQVGILYWQHFRITAIYEFFLRRKSS